MAFEQKDNTFSLFKNSYKKSEKQPDYSGNITVNGEKFEMSAWLNNSKNGKYLGGKIQTPFVKKGESKGVVVEEDDLAF